MQGYKPSRAILRGSRILEDVIKRIGNKDQLYLVYDELDLLWKTGQFAPSPESRIRRMFPSVHLTPTEVMYLILAWQEDRTMRDLDSRR